MNNIEIKNKFDVLLKQLSTERSFDVAEKVTAELVGLLNIKVSDRFLVNIPRVDAELTRFQLAPGFARQAAAYELPHEDDKPIDLKLFWTKKASKTNLSWIIGLTPNFEDALSNDYKNMGIDFVVPETCDSVIVLLSNRFKIRALELKDHITPTQLEIFAQWSKLSDLAITDQNELKSTLHAKLWDSFNFEPINRKFYLELVEHFSILVHHLEKDFGRKPSVMFTTRLIGRLLFIWFLKKKNLVNEKVDYFYVPNTENQKEYYETKLEKLFFEVLNIEELQRDNGDKLTPYLNGGLFDKNTTDFYNDSKLTFPNGYFNQLFTTLNKYNFTVDESSPEFQHVAIDPEMLGRIFESLLAEQIDEITGNSKKKSTGAFYTPREIVSYMCEQSLIEYLKTKVPETPDRDRRIDELVCMPEAIFRDQDQNKRRDWKPYREAIIRALDGTNTESPLTVLDPAVGSGAFPMGMLHLLVKVYSRLDPKFEKDISGLKREILSRSLYGVDIEQTAIEITRLRAWLSIIVDIPEGENVEPLPNLEFKFVCANTLIPLDNSEQATFFTDHDLKDKLITIRDDYFKTSSKAKKEKLQKAYLKLTQNNSLFDNKKTQQLKSYKPFDISSSSEFYDPELMHGVQAFDVVIGNPPYVRPHKINKEDKIVLWKYFRPVFEAKSDLYACFIQKSIELLRQKGTMSFIVSKTWLSLESFTALREFILNNTSVLLLSIPPKKTFKTATVETVIAIFQREKSEPIRQNNEIKISLFNGNEFLFDKMIKQSLYQKTHLHSFDLSLNNFTIALSKKILNQTRPLIECVDFSYGIKSGDDKKYISIIESSPQHKKLLRRSDFQKYTTIWRGEYVWYVPDQMRKNRNTARPGTSERFESKKILIQDIGKNIIATIDNDKYYIKDALLLNFKQNGSDLRYVLGLLNSNLLNYYYKNTFSNLSVSKNAILTLPIHVVNSESPNEIEAEDTILRLVDQILTLKKQNKDVDIKNLESQIDQLVYKLYGLTPEEIEIVENSSKK